MSTEPRIHVLPDVLVKKIAAGEVIERPASIVKELIDNAVDAEATRIAVTVEDGGKQLIRVTDDGVGMTPEELRLSVTPHATSKLRAEEDLYRIATMGFRGEALASVSSVARLRIVSRPRDTVEGHEIRVAADEVEACQAAGCAVGTTVEVRDLFFNVPARRKFLRARSTEVGHVNEQFARAAIARPDIGFELTNNGRRMHNLGACASRLERIGRFYSVELASALLKIERREPGLVIQAYAAPPAQTRANTQWQYVYVNGRYIRDRFVQHAIREAYRGLIEHNRQPVIFLFLTIDPERIDVNVHPTKIEVRWADSNLIHSQVLSTLREAFQQADLTPALRADRAAAPVNDAERDRVRREFAAAMKAVAPITPGQPPAAGVGSAATVRAGEDIPVRRPGALRPDDPTQPWRTLYGPPAPASGGGAGDAGGRPERPGAVFGPTAADDRMRGAVLTGADAIGSGAIDASGLTGPPAGSPTAPPVSPESASPRAVQMHNLYVVAEADDGIVIIDQHALHERIMYEEIKTRIMAGALESQRLLLPETVSVTPEQAALLETNGDLLHRLGIDVTPFGHDTVAVSAFPVLLKDADVGGFMRDLIDHLAQQPAGTSAEAVIHPIIDMMACKAAVKGGDSLTSDEIQALIRRKDVVDKSSNCPHGRPTMLRFTRADLDRQFKRT
ncbi:MAG: DNA mismatch repair endonuclease MutL [Phycisphaerae bacterium]